MSYPRFAVALGLAGAVVVAAIVATSLPAVFAQAPPQGQALPKFTAGTTVVEVDVIVRDGKRQFVADLQRRGLRGPRRRRPAGDVRLVPRHRAGRHGGRDGGPAAASPLPAPPAQQVQRVLVFFFDHAHMQPGGVDRAKKAALGFLQNDFRPGDVGGVLDGNRMVNNRLTSSKEELETAVQGVKPAPEMSEILREVRASGRGSWTSSRRGG